MNHLTQPDVTERLEYILQHYTGEDSTSIQLPIMIYIQLSFMFGDIDADTRMKLLNEYLRKLQK